MTTASGCRRAFFPRTFALILIGAMGACSFSGCERLFQTRSEQRLAIADKKFAAGDYLGSVLMYEASLDGTVKTADIHYKLALIYDDQLHKPISAIHHFQRYVDLAPGGNHAKEALNLIRDDQFKLVTAMGDGATVTQVEAKRLMNDNRALRTKVLVLQTDLERMSKERAAFLKSMGVKGVAHSGQVQKPLVPDVRTYPVEPGDTLASIAKKFYKSSARWKDIQDANFDPMEGTARLKPGMVLMIP